MRERLVLSCPGICRHGVLVEAARALFDPEAGAEPPNPSTKKEEMTGFANRPGSRAPGSGISVPFTYNPIRFFTEDFTEESSLFANAKPEKFS